MLMDQPGVRRKERQQQTQRPVTMCSSEGLVEIQRSGSQELEDQPQLLAPFQQTQKNTPVPCSVYIHPDLLHDAESQ